MLNQFLSTSYVRIYTEFSFWVNLVSIQIPSSVFDRPTVGLNGPLLFMLDSQIMCCMLPGDSPKHNTFEEAVTSESVVSVNAPGHLSGRIQPRQ